MNVCKTVDNCSRAAPPDWLLSPDKPPVFDRGYTGDRNDAATERAYRKARQARFEHGQTPFIRRRYR